MSAHNGVPEHYFSPETFFGEVPVCASPEPVEKWGANAGPEEVAESRESAGPGAAL